MAAIGVSLSSSFAPDSSKAKSATASIFGMIDEKSNIDPSDESGTTLDNIKGEIELLHISFKYPSRPDIQIFRDLNLTIHSGKTVALVGESESGTSTVIALLQRFYDPDSDVITIDGIEIRQLQVKWLRQQMGLVSQEPVLFNDTIRANIAYGKGGNATEAEIIAASELANAHRFISGLQQKHRKAEYSAPAVPIVDGASVQVRSWSYGKLKLAFQNQIFRVRVNTRLLYQQTKFNLLREESEGYAKLAALFDK